MSPGGRITLWRTLALGSHLVRHTQTMQEYDSKSLWKQLSKSCDKISVEWHEWRMEFYCVFLLFFRQLSWKGLNIAMNLFRVLTLRTQLSKYERGYGREAFEQTMLYVYRLICMVGMGYATRWVVTQNSL